MATVTRPARGQRAVRSLATLATFGASGLFHELLFWYFAEPYVWGISTFFFVQVRGAARDACLSWLTGLGAWGVACAGHIHLRCMQAGRFRIPERVAACV